MVLLALEALKRYEKATTLVALRNVVSESLFFQFGARIGVKLYH